MRSLPSVGPFALLLAVACSPSAEPPPPAVDLEAERAALMAADRGWYEAYAASDSPADVFAGQVVDDARLLPPGAPRADGREAVREVIAQLESLPGFSVSWAPAIAEVGGGGDLGYTIGSYQMTVPGPDGEPATVVGKYLTVWEKQPDGRWMVAADMFNADAPPPPAAAE